MEVHKKIKEIRESMKLSQGYLAHELGLDQSQYSRREKGEVSFSAEEIKTISKLLETTISNLFGEESNIFNNIDQKGGNFGQYISISEKLIEQYEIRLKEKDEVIFELREENKISKKS